MKTYDHSDAVETLKGILSVQNNRMLAEELAKAMVKLEHWTIRDLELSLRKDNGKFIIKIGDQE